MCYNYTGKDDFWLRSQKGYRGSKLQAQCVRRQSFFFFLWHCDPTPFMASSFLMFLDHTQRRSTVGRTPLDECSARRRDLYLTKHNAHNRQTSMPPVGFEPTISGGERPQTYALDRADIGTGSRQSQRAENFLFAGIFLQKPFFCVYYYINYTYSVQHNTRLSELKLLFYVYVTCFDLYLDHPQTCQYRNRTKEGIIKSKKLLVYSQYYFLFSYC